MKKKLLTIQFILAVLSVSAQTIIYVKPAASGQGTSWTDACNLEIAVTKATSGSQIWVQEGAYYPSGTLFVHDSVKLYGGFAGMENDISQRDITSHSTVIDAQNGYGPVVHLNSFSELNGFVIKNGTQTGQNQNGGGVWADNNTIIENCIVKNNTAYNGGGVYGKGDVKIINCEIRDNTVANLGYNTYGHSLTFMAGSCGFPDSLPPISFSGCGDDTFNFGTVSFASDTVWVVCTQVWSDAVTAAGCQKATYDGGTYSGPYNVDCRSNPEYPGDFFSWCAAVRYSATLCPAPWRVPTKQEFMSLDINLGGDGNLRTNFPSPDPVIISEIPEYIGAGSTWGGSLGGRVKYNDGKIISQGSSAHYWSQTERDSFGPDFGHNLLVTWSEEGSNGLVCVSPQEYEDKFSGLSLRCIRDTNKDCKVPSIETHPNTLIHITEQNGAFSALSVSVSDTAQISYRWYSNTTDKNTGGMPIPGATSASYTPSSATVGRLYYYCAVSNACSRVVSNVSGLHVVMLDSVLGCDCDTFDFGTVSFASNTEWTIGSQIWSDAVQTTNCNKSTYLGADTNGLHIDCRSNPGYPGDFFSWCAVGRQGSTLCPAPWRVPTLRDFTDLDIALGGNGIYHRDTAVLEKYIGPEWGGVYGGTCGVNSPPYNQGVSAYYWSKTEINATTCYNLYLDTNNTISPQNTMYKFYGFSLRCVRDL